MEQQRSTAPAMMQQQQQQQYLTVVAYMTSCSNKEARENGRMKDLQKDDGLMKGVYSLSEVLHRICHEDV